MNNTRHFPRVLVVDANPFCKHMNIGIFKSNLFQGWPKQSLAQIMYSNVQPGFDVCNQYWQLGKTAILLGALGFPSEKALGLAAMEATGGLYDPERAYAFEARPLFERLLAGASQSIRVPIGEGILRLPSLISKPLSRWITHFAPDVIFTNGGNGAMLRLAVKVAELCRVPLVPCFNDDWISTVYDGDLFRHLLRASCMRWLGRSLSLSRVRLGTSDALSREYGQRYGGQFYTFMNSIDRFDATPEPSLPAVQFTFIGALAPNRWLPLLSIGTALAKLRNRGINGELVVHTFPDDIRQFGHRLAQCDAIRVAGTVPLEDVTRVQLGANVLVHVESFDETSRANTRLSLSTKIPQYLMAGRCVLAHGPAELASIEYIKETGAGLVVSTENVDLLASELETLISRPALRRSYAEIGRRTALARHDALSERERFRSWLSVAASENPMAGRVVSVGGKL